MSNFQDIEITGQIAPFSRRPSHRWALRYCSRRLLALLYCMNYDGFQWWEVFDKCLPNHRCVYTKVLMDELVSHSGHFPPRNGRPCRLKTYWYFVRRLSNNFKSSYNCVLSLCIPGKLIKIHAVCKLFCLVKGVEYVLKVINELTWGLHIMREPEWRLAIFLLRWRA